MAESLERLGLNRLQVVYLHDPEKMTFAEATAPGGAVEALVQLRKEGVIDHLGVAGGPIDLMLQYLATGLFDDDHQSQPLHPRRPVSRTAT